MNSLVRTSLKVIILVIVSAGIIAVAFVFNKPKNYMNQSTISNSHPEVAGTTNPTVTTFATPTVTPIVSLIPTISLTETLKPSPTAIKPVTTSQVKINTAAWIPAFDFNRGYDSFKRSKNTFANVQCACASLNDSGVFSLSSAIDDKFSKLNSQAKPFGLNIYSGSNASAANHFKSTENKNAMMQAVMDLRSKYANFKEINLNFEKVAPWDKEIYIEFLTVMREFTIKNDLKLYITIYEKTDSAQDAAQDLKVIGEKADYIVLMAYDYHRFNTSKEIYSPNSPNYWIEDILKYATSQMQKEKIILGLPLYGYGYQKNSTSRKQTKSYTYSQINDFINKEKLTATLDTDAIEMYIDRTSERIYFQNQITLDAKKNLAKKYGVEKVFYWRLGGEGELK